MITAKNRSAHEAVDYYTQKLDGASLTSRWYGKGAANLGLSGEIKDKDIFANVCNGYTPDGSKKLGRNTKRAAIDLTFSVPKSVSLSALVGGDDRLIDAHRQAVEQTLAVIEKHHAQTRIRAGGRRWAVNTGNLIVAQFDHFESRELDPHLHTHALVMNLTWVESVGSWYSLNNGEVYKHKKPLSMLHQAYLKQKVQQLGYAIEEQAEGLFEIAGYTRDDLMHFSKRRQQILAETGIGARWKTREEAWEITRQAKQHLALDQLRQRWREQFQVLRIVPVVTTSVKEIEKTHSHVLVRTIEPPAKLRP